MGWVKRHNGRFLVHGTGGTVLLPKGANKQKPWLDARGVPLAADVLAETSESWNWIRADEGAAGTVRSLPP